MSLLKLLVIANLFAAEPLPEAKLKALKANPCVYVHAWATWCSICITELPEVLRYAESKKGITPVILDISSGFAQDNFSKRYIASLEPKVTTYLKPAHTKDDYLKVIDPNWNGALPYTAVFSRGKMKKRWIGSVKLDAVDKELKSCR